MPTSLVNLSTTEYVKVNSQLNGIVLQSLRDRVRLSFSVAKPAVTNTVYHVLSGADDPLSIRNMDTDLWALATSDNCSLVATEFENTEGTIEVTIDDVGVKDSGDTRIDPATKQNQEAVIVTEDEPSVDAQKGVAMMEVANEAQADLVSADGDETRGASDKKGTRYVRDEALKAEAVTANNHLQSIDDELVVANAELADQTLELEAANTKIGEVQESPTPNTVLGRLKDIWQAITGSKNQAWEEIFVYATPTDAALASGADFTINPVLNTETNALDSTWLQITGADGSHKPNQKITIKSDVNLVLHVMNATDASGNNITGNTAAEAITVFAGIPRVIASNFFTGYFRIVIKNISGSSATQLSVASYGGTASPVSFIGAINSLLLDFFPLSHVRAVLTGRKDDLTGVYDNVNVHSSNGFTSLAIGLGHRISQLFGRTHVNFTATVASTFLTPNFVVAYTVPAGKRLQITSLEVTATNSISTEGSVDIRDGGDTGVLMRQYDFASSTNQTDPLSAIGITYNEPLPMDSDVTMVLNVLGIGASSTLNIIGYLEDL